MSFAIKNQVDVFKFALPLYDYLSQNGYTEDAKVLEDLVNACFPTDARALESHRKAYRQIRDSVHDLPPQYQSALDAALGVLAEE